jgi:putative Mg2+ transporter-C (MgtC) family protein
MDFSMPLPWLVLLGRLALAVALGALVGIDRELSEKAAGLRTNMLVALGASLFVLIPIQSGLVEAEPSVLGRVIQGIITGVGFIGAGSILQKSRVRGLTSAAAVWMSAGLGLAAGLGQWKLAVTGSVITLIILRLMKFVEKKISSSL